MSPEAEKPRHAMSVVEIKWLQDNAGPVAELVDAALDLAAYGPSRVSRLYRAADAFKGTQEPPEPRREHVPVLRCSECDWYRRIENIEFTAVQLDNEAYRRHYRETHQGGKP